jgi:Ni2+-binding GTPase involved in maturation of urease and hydrogenase
MALAEIGNEGALNSTTAVDVVPSPGSGHTFIVRKVTVHNRDTVAASAIIQKVKGANTYRLAKVTLDPDATLDYECVIVLDATDEKVQAVLAGAVTTNQPHYDAAYADRS